MRFTISLLLFAAACAGQVDPGSGRSSPWTATRAGSGNQVATAPVPTRLFPGGTQVTGSVQCVYGTVDYKALTVGAASQEIVIQTGISGSVRWDQVTLSETTQFTGTTGLTVSMGRPGGNHAEMTGSPMRLMVSSGDANFWTTRPIPPQLTETYSIVLNFAVSSGTVDKAAAGVLTWEMCGYSAR
jgi:hypothetical protein